MERFLKDSSNEIRLAALRNLDVFLKQCTKATREAFLKFIQQSNEDSKYDWRSKLVLAQNLGKFAQLYDSDQVYSHFLPLFFRYFQDTVAKVSEAAAPSLIYLLERFNHDPHK